jgi:hypothetical protein
MRTVNKAETIEKINQHLTCQQQALDIIFCPQKNELSLDCLIQMTTANNQDMGWSDDRQKDHVNKK